MMSLFKFWDDSYYDSRGCSCCEGTWMEAYNSVQTDSRLGTAHSLEDCYFQSILTTLGLDNVDEQYSEELYCMSLDEVKEAAKALGIKVKVIS